MIVDYHVDNSKTIRDGVKMSGGSAALSLFLLPMICGRFHNELEVGGDLQLIAPNHEPEFEFGAFKNGTHPTKLCACKQGVSEGNLEPAA